MTLRTQGLNSGWILIFLVFSACHKTNLRTQTEARPKNPQKLRESGRTPGQQYSGLPPSRLWNSRSENSADPITCRSENPNHLCLGLKYLVYRDHQGKSVMNEKDAHENVRTINRIFKQCNIGFQIDEFAYENPSRYGLNFSTATDSELDDIRKIYQDDLKMLIIITGNWDRTRSLGLSKANAWTNMPGTAPYGAILESSVGRYPNIIAHELGHYLNLFHQKNTRDLMNPVIYDISTRLTDAQCGIMRASAQTHWKKMLR